jgi:hypothetical protein
MLIINSPAWTIWMTLTSGLPSPASGGRGAAGKAKVVVAVETPDNKPRFVAMHLVPKVSSQEIQIMVETRLVEEVVVKTDVGKATVFWIIPPAVTNGESPVLAKRHRRSCLACIL